MIEAPLPQDEQQRLQTLRDLNVRYTPAEDRIDRITRLARRLLDAPIALVSLVGEDCQWFKSVQGLDTDSTPRAVSFCAHAILGTETFVIEDALADRRFADNPLVVGAPFIRFYAGQPLIADDGSRIGTLCVIDTRPRTLAAEDREALRDLAGWVTAELQVQGLGASQQELIRKHAELERRSMIVLGNCRHNTPNTIAERIRHRVAAEAYDTPAGPVDVTLSVGLMTWSSTESVDPAELIEAADRAHYAAKSNGRNRVVNCQ